MKARLCRWFCRWFDIDTRTPAEKLADWHRVYRPDLRPPAEQIELACAEIGRGFRRFMGETFPDPK